MPSATLSVLGAYDLLHQLLVLSPDFGPASRHRSALTVGFLDGRGKWGREEVMRAKPTGVHNDLSGHFTISD